MNWQRIRGLLATSLRITPRQAGDLGLDELEDLEVAWKTEPPAHIAIARLEAILRAWIGMDPREADERNEAPSSPEHLEAFFREVNGHAAAAQKAVG